MPAPRPIATADEIHAYLIDQLNLALRRPGIYGGELAIRILLNHLLFVENQPEAWPEHQRFLEGRGAWSAIGVRGAFRRWLVADGADDYGMASVYAEFVRSRGWLKPDRVLDSAEYKALRSNARPWAGEDRVWADVTAEFGPPSVLFGGTNPLYGKTLGYLTDVPREPMVCFHLWNGSAEGVEPSGPPMRNQALLLAVRFGDGLFSETFTYTPTGKRMRPLADG